jgi:hypothetical protein
MNSLQQIGLKYGTDKSLIHNFNGRTFLDVYERYFHHLKDSKITLMEMGVLNGASLKTWEEYFKNGKMVGLDIDPSKTVFNTNKTKIFIGSQNDKNLLNEIKNQYPEGFDIIIDDASHINELTIDSFNLLYKSIKPGGFYVIEDTHCCYGNKWFKNFSEDVKSWPGMSYNNPNVSFSNNREDFDRFLLEKIELLDKKGGDIFSVHIHSETIIIEKVKY